MPDLAPGARVRTCTGKTGTVQELVTKNEAGAPLHAWRAWVALDPFTAPLGRGPRQRTVIRGLCGRYLVSDLEVCDA